MSTRFMPGKKNELNSFGDMSPNGANLQMMSSMFQPSMQHSTGQSGHNTPDPVSSFQNFIHKGGHVMLVQQARKIIAEEIDKGLITSAKSDSRQSEIIEALHKTKLREAFLELGNQYKNQVQ